MPVILTLTVSYAVRLRLCSSRLRQDVRCGPQTRRTACGTCSTTLNVAAMEVTQSCPWVRLTHGLGWVGSGSKFLFLVGCVVSRV